MVPHYGCNVSIEKDKILIKVAQYLHKTGRINTPTKYSLVKYALNALQEAVINQIDRENLSLSQQKDIINPSKNTII